MDLHPLTESKLNLSQILPIERISSLATNLRYILQLLYSLSQQKMIPYNWVSLVVRNKMLAPQKSMIPSTRGAISSRLTELKNTTATFPEEEYVNIVKQLKEMY